MVDWRDQHPGVYQAHMNGVIEHMPEVAQLISDTFPEDPFDFTWCVKVHMLMPNQWPCIPGWHVDMVPRIEGKQDFSKVRYDLPLYLWLSGPPLTEFKDGRKIVPETWNRFTQADEHRGVMSDTHQWRGFVRGCHKDILAPSSPTRWKRRHSQVYLDSNFKW